MEEEQEPLYEVLAIVDGKLKLILDGLNKEQSNVLASNLFEMRFNVEVQKYWIE